MVPCFCHKLGHRAVPLTHGCAVCQLDIFTYTACIKNSDHHLSLFYVERHFVLLVSPFCTFLIEISLNVEVLWNTTRKALTRPSVSHCEIFRVPPSCTTQDPWPLAAPPPTSPKPSQAVCSGCRPEDGPLSSDVLFPGQSRRLHVCFPPRLKGHIHLGPRAERRRTL